MYQKPNLSKAFLIFFIGLSQLLQAGRADTTSTQLDVMSLSDSLEAEFLHSSFESNLDSLVGLWYVENALGVYPDSGWSEEPDTVYPWFPDSVYIDRLERLPYQVDLTYNKFVRNYIRVYTGKRRELVQVVLGLSEYYFPIFDEIFDYHDMPLELKYCSIIESALNPRAVSRARAAGIWQFMYGTGRMYGLTINSLVDERRDPIKSTHAAARFMKDLYRIYGDWTLVIAAYNCGPGNVNKAIRRSGGKRNFWDIYYYLPRETRGHVPAFIAAAYIMNYHQEHLLFPKPIELPIPADTIMINDNLHLEQVSTVLDIPLRMLRDINPQYKNDIIPGKEKPYALKIPVQYAMQFIELEDSIFAYQDSVYFSHKKVSRSPASYASSNALPEAPSPNMEKVTYTIQSGDNLGYIASWFHVKVSDLKYWNNIYGTTIRSGIKLIVYVPKDKVAYYSKIDQMSFAEKQQSIGKEVNPAGAPAMTVRASDNQDYVLYEVRPGDTLWDIAKKYPGVSDTDLSRLNGLNDGNRIKPGMIIKIKPK
jgi:membrane-bound lytic murein transglycosylase D